MSDKQRDQRLAAVVEEYLKHLETGSSAPDLDALPDDERADARAKLTLLAALWGTDAVEVPPLAEDPIAIRFGFDRVNPRLRIAGPRLNLLRRNAGLRSSDVAARLAAMGHDIDRPRLAQIENAASTTVDIELAAALAAILDARVADFEAPAPTPGARLTADDFTAHPLFITTITEWAAAHDSDPLVTAERGRERLLRLRHRGSAEFTAEEWRQVLLDVLGADES